jgi:hypothetical protein
MRKNHISTADLGVTTLSRKELQINGGSWLAVGIVIGGFIVAQWAELKQGFADGYNS